MRRVLIALLLLVAVATPVRAQGVYTATAQWDGSPTNTTNTLGYRVEYGTAAGVYTTTYDVGLNTSALIQNLAPGTPYFFTVVAYGINGLTARSAEVTFTPPLPTVDTCAYPLGANAVSIFPTRITTTGSGGPGSKFRIDFQVGSLLPIQRVALRANGSDLAIMTGNDLSALAGMWATVPRPPGVYAFSLNATNSIGCVREQSTTYTIAVP